MTPAISFSLLAIVFLTTACLTYLLMKVGQRKGILDIPNDRSSHTSPVPRVGGLAIVIAFLVFLCVIPSSVREFVDPHIRSALLIGGVMISVIGFVDDFNHVSAWWRLLTHLLAAFLSLSLLPSLPHIPVFGLSLELGVFGYFFFALSLVWFVNLFNFMDGIDGIAGVEAISVLAGGALIMFWLDQSDWLVLSGVLAACVAGFLVWNWPPAKVFMGDTGSGFLGFSIGVLAIATSTIGALNVWCWLILLGVFVVDATITLVVRMLRGDRWFEPHRSHAYQILSRRQNSHKIVSFGVLLINVLWLVPLAFWAAKSTYWAAAICFLALAPLVFTAIRAGAGKREV